MWTSSSKVVVYDFDTMAKYQLVKYESFVVTADVPTNIRGILLKGSRTTDKLFFHKVLPYIWWRMIPSCARYSTVYRCMPACLPGMLSHLLARV